jgi:hypothetical protein
VKRVVTILFISFFLQAGIAHALIECFKRAHNAHEQDHEQTLRGDADYVHVQQKAPAVSIHCIESQLQLALMLPSSEQTISKRSLKYSRLLWTFFDTHAPGSTAAAPPNIFRFEPNSSSPCASIYLVFSVLRI